MPRLASKRSPKGYLSALVRKLGVACMLATLAVGAVIGAGLSLAPRIPPRDRFTLHLADLEYTLPPWVDERTFLAEVRYLGELPEAFNSYDEAAISRVKAAFELHPWVEKVDGGSITIERHYRLDVTFREPALRVIDSSSTTWMVDAHGVLLPSIHILENLPLLKVAVAPRTHTVGHVWDDPIVIRAANLAKQFPANSIEKIDNGWRITERSGRVLIVGW